MKEFTIHEYSSRAVATHAPVSITDILLLIVVVPVVVTIVHVTVITGTIISIRSTVAVASPVFPAKSWNVKRNDPLSVNMFPVEFSPVSVSDQLSIATTFPLVRFHEAGVYSIVAIGEIVSTTFTVLVTSTPVFPFASVILYVTIYVHAMNVLTGFTVMIPVVILPS